MAPSVFFSRGALEAKAGFCGNASSVPDSSESIARRTSQAPIWASRASSSTAVSSALDGRAALGDHRPGVDLGGHVDHADPRLLVAVDQGPVDGGRSAVLGQQRGVQVDAAETCLGQRRVERICP